MKLILMDHRIENLITVSV